MASALDVNPEGSLLRMITEAVHREVDRAIEQVADEAAEQVKREIRSRAATVAASVLQHFDMTMRGQQITITIDTRGLEKK